MSEETRKVPSQIFRWFERMKESYDKSIHNTLTKFESLTHQQQKRIDEAHKSQLARLTELNEKQSNIYVKQIEQLHKDVNYYRQQLDKQQQTIDELNTRYDTVIQCMLPKVQTHNIKDIFSVQDFLNPIENDLPKYSENKDTLVSDAETPQSMHEPSATINQSHTEQEVSETNKLFEQAINKRNEGDNIYAFKLFEQAAKQGHAKSMGAMGRAYFLGEGVDEDQATGLAWLINAANLELPQAIDRVEHFIKTAPDLYQEAKVKSQHIL